MFILFFLFFVQSYYYWQKTQTKKDIFCTIIITDTKHKQKRIRIHVFHAGHCQRPELVKLIWKVLEPMRGLTLDFRKWLNCLASEARKILASVRGGTIISHYYSSHILIRKIVGIRFATFVNPLFLSYVYVYYVTRILVFALWCSSLIY